MQPMRFSIIQDTVDHEGITWPRFRLFQGGESAGAYFSPDKAAIAAYTKGAKVETTSWPGSDEERPGLLSDLRGRINPRSRKGGSEFGKWLGFFQYHHDPEIRTKGDVVALERVRGLVPSTRNLPDSDVYNFIRAAGGVRAIVTAKARELREAVNAF